MQIDITEIGGHAVKRVLDEGVQLFGLEMRRKMRLAVAVLKRAVRSSIRSKFAHDKGELSASIGTKVSGTPVHLEGRVGIYRRVRITKPGGQRSSLASSSVPSFFIIHETGGVIRPKARGAKAQKNAATRVGAGHGRRRDTHALLTFAIVRGGVFAGWRSAAQVTIPARPFLGPAADAKGTEASAIVGDTFGIFQAGRVA